MTEPTMPLPFSRLAIRLLLPALAASGGYYAGWRHGAHDGQNQMQTRIAILQAQHSQSLQHQQAQALLAQQKWQQRINQLEAELLRQQHALQQQQRLAAQRIDHVITQDGPRYTGLGPDSLRLYRQLLGYSADLPGAQPLAAGNSPQAAGPASGLPAADLLAHAADYGVWCQQLEQRLIALRQLFSPPEPHP
ncbi:hypothetical protein [Chromobacterium sp. IIBBL 290-4]|uniref:hypothetical protein n=1 Tax=Chromobacterium sp. IIBBL 290-4 TaxID=2953890 RepID=UPI0020B828C8|nr:hypothetical protein [Chromobacterium sp. IIBBL 290-4]UTH76028.1 hypothetical protein NKT35_07950 [Chromobacterium sp. IIBBL 290-4]